MKTLYRDLAILILAAILLCPVGARTQDILCGDVNGDETFNISDVLMVIDYLVADVMIDESLFEFDNRVGVTIGDVYVATNIWENGRGLYDCNPTLEYSFTEAPGDTIYIPYWPEIPDDKTTVYLPVATTTSFLTRAIYLPLLYQAEGSSDAFEFIEAFPVGEHAMGGGGPLIQDTIVFFTGVAMMISIPGNEIMHSLQYNRVNSDDGGIYTGLTDRQDALKYAVFDVGNYDLFRPVVVEVDVSFPIGDCNCDRQVDISDITCMVGWMFGEWPSACEPYLQPFSVYIKDLDCSGSVDISDLTYYVDHLFRGGPPPCNPFMP